MHKNMNKHLPYRTPEGVFDEIERNVLSATGCGRRHRSTFRTAGLAFAAAASLALIVSLAWPRQPEAADSLAEVQQAFEKLDNADQAFLSEIYLEDTFININY